MVARRTVFNQRQIEDLCSAPVLTMLFRQAGVLNKSIKLRTLIDNEILRAPPQSITRLTDEAATWLQTQMNM